MMDDIDQHFRVSVIIPVYNSVQYLKQAVKSAIQLQETGELILVEDGSKDGSLNMCLELEDRYPKVKLLQHGDKQNHGASKSRSLGIKNASCNFISFLDADDLYLPNRFSVTKQIFESNNKIDGVYNATEAFFESPKAEKLYLQRFSSNMFTLSRQIVAKELLSALLFGEFGQFHTNSITVKKTLFDKTGMFDPELTLSQDVHMWCKMAAVGNIVAGELDKPVAKYRIHENNRIHVDKNTVQKYKRMLHENLFFWALQQKNFTYNKKNLFFMALRAFYQAGPHKISEKKLLKNVMYKRNKLKYMTFYIRKWVQIIKQKK